MKKRYLSNPSTQSQRRDWRERKMRPAPSPKLTGNKYVLVACTAGLPLGTEPRNIPIQLRQAGNMIVAEISANVPQHRRSAEGWDEIEALKNLHLLTGCEIRIDSIALTPHVLFGVNAVAQ